MFFSCEKKCAILTEPEWLADQHGEWFIFIIYRITMIAWLDRRIYWSPLTKRRSYLRAWKTGTDKLFSYINFTSISLCFWIQYLFVILYAIQWLNELIKKSLHLYEIFCWLHNGLHKNTPINPHDMTDKFFAIFCYLCGHNFCTMQYVTYMYMILSYCWRLGFFLG